jgi:hypothetical protein
MYHEALNVSASFELGRRSAHSTAAICPTDSLVPEALDALVFDALAFFLLDSLDLNQFMGLREERFNDPSVEAAVSLSFADIIQRSCTQMSGLCCGCVR